MTKSEPPAPDFRLLFESVPGLYLVLTPELEIVAASDAYLAATMTKRQEIVGRGLFDVFPDNPGDPAATGVANLRASLERAIASGRADAMAVQKYDVRRPEAEGGDFQERHWSPLNSPVLDERGRVRYVIHRVEDVTEFVALRAHDAERTRRAEELVERSAAMEGEIFQRARELQDANQALRELRDALEQRVEVRTEELSKANHELERAIDRYKTSDDALQKSEAQLRHSQKMEAIGRLAGSVAHDFNNLLSVIVGASDMLLEDLKPVDPMRLDVEAIRKAGQRASELTRQLLAFSRQQVLAPRLLDLNELVQESQKMLARLLGEDVELVLSCGRAVPRIRADPGQLDQVIMNLAINARDAMPAGGKLTIETQAVVLDEDYASQHLGVKSGPHVMLAVSDTGLGMDRDTQARIFEPFFTTKDPGKGTGLGLSTVFGIVKQSGGNVWVYSEPGNGTTFRIYLPVARGVDFEPIEVVQPTTLRGTETVLLVEDQNDVRHVTQQILRRYGYHVLPARNAGEALLIFEQHPRTIHLLLTDMVMPQMSGRKLAERLVKSRPSLKVLFMSGYAEVSSEDGEGFSELMYLQKPIVPEALARRVREVLDTAKRPSKIPPSG